MKTLIIYFTLSLLLVVNFTGCKKDSFEKKNQFAADLNRRETTYNMKVIIDCSGTYLQDVKTNRDYHVCNAELIKPFNHGKLVNVTYKKIASCRVLDSVVVCMLYHENDGWIEIVKIAE